MKVKLGMRVSGEIAQGPVIAMTKEWCVYTDEDDARRGKYSEIAEPWDSIMIVAEKPDAIEGSLAESPNEVQQEN